jgi:hypothetical protein
LLYSYTAHPTSSISGRDFSTSIHQTMKKLQQIQKEAERLDVLAISLS